MTVDTKTKKLVLSAVMICLIVVTTILFKIPIPFANGYVHLGDAMVFLSVLILGVKYGVIASAIGSALGDVMGGFAIWAPWTLVIKGLMALILGFFVSKTADKKTSGSFSKATAMQIAGMFVAGIWMTAGYFVAEGVMYNWIVAFVGIPWNIGQFVVGMVIASATAAALSKNNLIS